MRRRGVGFHQESWRPLYVNLKKPPLARFQEPNRPAFQLLVERIDANLDGANICLRTGGLPNLVAELRVVTLV